MWLLRFDNDVRALERGSLSALTSVVNTSSRRRREEGTGTPVHTRHKHSVEYDEGTGKKGREKQEAGSPRFSFPFPVFLLVNIIIGSVQSSPVQSGPVRSSPVQSSPIHNKSILTLFQPIARQFCLGIR